MRKTDHQLDILLTYPRSNLDGTHARLRVEDPLSGMIIIEVDLDPAQLMQFMSSSTARVRGYISPHLGRVGKKMTHYVVVVPRFRRYEIEGDDADEGKVKELQSIEANLRESWEAVSRNWTRDGLQLTCRNWVEA